MASPTAPASCRRWKNTHTDEQLATVLTYAGERWHGWNRKVTGEDIARIRMTSSPAPPMDHED